LVSFLSFRRAAVSHLFYLFSYNINGKSYSQEAKVSPFSVAQLQPGLFTVISIAHQQKMCKAVVTDLRFQVHDLPSAQVGHGKKILQDIHEGMNDLFTEQHSADWLFPCCLGDQAEIIFTLIGEPPFTFTYQRSELAPKKGGPGKVLETHTVSRVLTHEYSIFSALEGWYISHLFISSSHNFGAFRNLDSNVYI
jgi:nucleoporin POM152